MPRLDRELIVTEALALLDAAGLDAVTTRRLAQRLGVEQPSLYWHFHNKAALLRAMAEAAMAAHATAPLPAPGDDWRQWFLANQRSFRRTLLAHRDGARLHAGSSPQGEDLVRGLRKRDFLVASGLPERDAGLAMLAASHFTVGSVLEEQAEAGAEAGADAGPAFSYQAAYEAGLSFLIDGLAQRAG